jgi:exopolyphosphatase/guanosine-5'-triphosphate,3'-diphosphate pyrophosphatase
MSGLFAAVDCGTNSVRLLVARVGSDGELEEVDRRLHLTRLGQGVDATGRFAPEALARTLAAMADFGVQLDALGVAAPRLVATSAARDAANSAEFFDRALARLGVPAEIISGEEEAWLSYTGAVRGLGLAGPALVMDIGGGSTELVAGSGQAIAAAVSLPMGSVRLRERFLAGDPPLPGEVASASDYVDGLLDGCGVEFTAGGWVGVGGTATSLSALAQRLPAYDRAVVHGSMLAPDALRDLTRELLAMPVARVLGLPTMVPGRADVICAGALVCERIGRRVPGPLLVSEADILDGMVLSLAGVVSPPADQGRGDD